MPLNCLVLPETRRWLREQGGSQGELVDRAVAVLKNHEPKKLLVDKTGSHDLIPPMGGFTGTVTVDAAEKSATVNVSLPRQSVPPPKPFRAPLLKPSEKGKKT